MMVKINAAKEIVRTALVKYPKVRDDLHKLLAVIWQAESKEKTTVDFLRSLYIGKYLSVHSIERQSRKLQQDHPELRGKLWAERQQHQKHVKEDLGYKTDLFN